MVLGCPQHGLDMLTLIRVFFDGLHPSVQQFAEESTEGRFSDAEGAWDALQELADF